MESSVESEADQRFVQYPRGRYLPTGSEFLCIFHRIWPGQSTDEDFSRCYISTAGQFDISQKWVWGWTGIVVTDPTFYYDYGLAGFNPVAIDPFRTGTDVAYAGLSQLYLVGRGDRSYFDVRSIYYTGFSQLDQQQQLPFIHPVLDYSNVVPHDIWGGELSYKTNLTSLSREQASYDPISQYAITNSICANGIAETAEPALLNRSNCLLRGIPGDYNRGSAEVDWRRTVTTPDGEQFTPFFQMRGDVASLSVQNQPGVSNYIGTGDSDLARVMPVAGLEYHYPFIDVQPWGTQTIEPIAQLILRPNESSIGKFPNEDAQSLVFDDTNLFQVDKFSGWDRIEGGSRLNAGLQYTAQVNGAGSLNALFGQSYQLFGQNSFAQSAISQIPVLIAVSIKPFPIMSPASPISRTRHTVSALMPVSTSRHLRLSDSKSKHAQISIVGA